MLRIKPPGKRERGERAAQRAELYYEKSDAGYYRGEGGLHCEWGGKDAPALGLEGEPEFEHFKRLLRGLDPHTGEQLTARLVDDRLPGWDVTGSVPKGVTEAMERGDDRIQGLLWKANRLAMGDMEGYATTRVRMGDRQEDRVTGNMLWYSVEHAETRPVVDESFPEGHQWRVMPQPDRHIHNYLLNLTRDDAEGGRYKALKIRPIMDIRRFFDRRFDHYLAHLLSEAGYEIETKYRRGKYYSWDIKGMPAELIDRRSKRSHEIADLEAAIVAGLKETARLEGDPAWDKLPDHLTAVARDRLGATSRRQKREDITLEECREYWASGVLPEEAEIVDALIARAKSGQNPRSVNVADRAVEFALRHHSEQESCFRWEELAATAMERSMGGASPQDIEREAARQGIIISTMDGVRMATTAGLRAEERYLADVALLGMGDVAAVGVPQGLSRETEDGKHTLNDGQWDAARGLLESENRINLVEGPAGAGKSSMLAKYAEAMRKSGQMVTYLATTGKAVGVLEKDGFTAETLARFLVDERMQAAAKGGRVVVDEVSMLGHKDAVRLFKLAERLDLKLVLLGDPMQHGSVGRGAIMRLLKEFGLVTPFVVPEILRQKHAEDGRYLTAATQLSQGKTAEGFDTLDAMGWVREIPDDTDRYRHIAADYLQAQDDKKSCLVVSPTHLEAERITAMIRHELRAAKRLGEKDKTFTRLEKLDASEAERGQAGTYDPDEIYVLQFHKHAKGYKRGEYLTVLGSAVPVELADRFTVYRPESFALAEGDRIRFTGTVKTLDGGHALKNGMTKTVAEITPGGNLRLDNGWVISGKAGHIRHGYVETSFGSQGSTVQRTIVSLCAQSGKAANQEMAYVASTRSKERMTLYTDAKDDIREAIVRSSKKPLALDMPVAAETPHPAKAVDKQQQQRERQRRLAVIERVRAAWHQVRPQKPQKQRQVDHGYRR